MRSSSLALLVLLAGCVQPIAARCPSCVVVDAAHPDLPVPKAGARRLFVLIPGVLGYGWEWDRAVAALKESNDSDFFIFWWEPWGSLRRASAELGAALGEALWRSPGRIREVVVVGHSVGGMVAAHALGALTVPAGKKLTVVTIGAPFAGMLGPPFALEDALGSPAMMSVMGTFRAYPKAPQRSEVISYVTSYPADPVMQGRYGHVVAPPAVGPRGARRVLVDPKFDHNQIVSLVVLALLAGPAPSRLSP